MKQHKPGPFYFKLLSFLKLKIGIIFETLKTLILNFKILKSTLNFKILAKTEKGTSRGLTLNLEISFPLCQLHSNHV